MSGTISATGTTTIGYTGQIVTEAITTTGYYDMRRHRRRRLQCRSL